MVTTRTIHNIVSLDVGERRVGVAVANTLARLPRPLMTLERGDSFWSRLEELLAAESADVLVVGLPRSLDGHDTAQTTASRKFAKELEERFGLPVKFQDEALTSRQAEAELKRRGRAFDKADIDALAATYILEDYLNARGEER